LDKIKRLLYDARCNKYKGILCTSHFLRECYPARVHISLYAMPRMIFREWPERGRKKKVETKGFFRLLIVTVNAKLSERLINLFAMNLYRCGMSETWRRMAVDPHVSAALFPGNELPVSIGDKAGLLPESVWFLVVIKSVWTSSLW